MHTRIIRRVSGSIGHDIVRADGMVSGCKRMTGESLWSG